MIKEKQKKMNPKTFNKNCQKSFRENSSSATLHSQPTTKMPT